MSKRDGVLLAMTEIIEKMYKEKLIKQLTLKIDYIDKHYPKGDAYWSGRIDSIRDIIEGLKDGEL